ncbi:hypothetical protein BDZ97DRAFT_1918570 [Flammula alnicola]|nr:hypothetical protein BDZ97DRAFT_1918570 [Flammula alnicola]
MARCPSATWTIQRRLKTPPLDVEEEIDPTTEQRRLESDAAKLRRWRGSGAAAVVTVIGVTVGVGDGVGVGGSIPLERIQLSTTAVGSVLGVRIALRMPRGLRVEQGKVFSAGKRGGKLYPADPLSPHPPPSYRLAIIDSIYGLALAAY